MPALRDPPDPAIERLKQRGDFVAVAAGRQRYMAPGLILQTRPHRTTTSAQGSETGSPPGMRVGFTASRKVGNAVARNRARRRLRAVADAVLPRHAAPGHDYVIIARTETLTRPFSMLVRDLETALRRLGVWCPGEAAADGG